MSEWISIKDELPKPNNWIVYAVLTNENRIHKHQIAYYSTSKKWHLESDPKNFINVTHWIPLPEHII